MADPAVEDGTMLRLLAMHPLGVPHVERAGLPLVLQVAGLVLFIGLVLWAVADHTGWRRRAVLDRSSHRMPRQPWLSAERVLAAEPGEVLVADHRPAPPHPPRRHRPVHATAVTVDRWLARVRVSLGWGGGRQPIALHSVRVDPLTTRSVPAARDAAAMILLGGEVVVAGAGEAVVANRRANTVGRLRAGDRAVLAAGDAVVIAPPAGPSLSSGRSGALVAVVTVAARGRRMLPARLAIALAAAAMVDLALPNMRFLEVAADFLSTTDTRRLALLGEVFTILVAAGAALVLAAPALAAVAFLGAAAAGSALAVYPYLPNRVVYSGWPNAAVWTALSLGLAVGAIGVRVWESRARSRPRRAPATTGFDADAGAISWSLHDG
jgi:hypothetical protein